MTNSTNISIEDWVVNQLNRLQEREFYGKFIVEMKQGNVVLLRLEETLKPTFTST